MGRRKETRIAFSSDEVFRPADTAAAARAVGRGELRRIAPGIYTPNLSDPLERVVARNWLEVAGLVYPGSVLVDRSAIMARPTEDGRLFLDGGPDRHAITRSRIHGLNLIVRPGCGPLPGDMPMKHLFIASRARAALENQAPTRARSHESRTLTSSEIELWLDDLAARLGPDELNGIRDEAKALAVGRDEPWNKWLARLDATIGALQGTRRADLLTAAASARGAGEPYDSDRLELFDKLRSELASHRVADQPEISDPAHIFAFYEAYLSNFIEGTEFVVEEAARIVFEGYLPADRPADAHDILSTYSVIVDPRRRATVPDSADDLIAIARAVNRTVLRERPATRPGEFKREVNRAGRTVFVAPDLVNGTLRQGWRYLESLQPGFARGVFLMFLISEVHPFVDGNGRTARLLLNAELSAASQARFIVPLSFREDYLGALRAMSRSGNPAPLPRMVERVLGWVRLIDWSSMQSATADLTRANALVSPDESDFRELRLRNP